MKDIAKIKEIINEHRTEIEEKYKVKSIALFGSYVRNEQTADSDIDVLVELKEPVGFLFFHLADYLEEITGAKIDLVTKDGIKPNRRKYILNELVHV